MQNDPCCYFSHIKQHRFRCQSPIRKWIDSFGMRSDYNIYCFGNRRMENEMTHNRDDLIKALDYLSDVLAWAEVGIQQAPRGKTVPDLNSAGITIRAALQSCLDDGCAKPSIHSEVYEMAMASLLSCYATRTHDDLHPCATSIATKVNNKFGGNYRSTPTPPEKGQP